jgi:hypothetical protein
MRRPDSLAEVSRWTTSRSDFDLHLADFIDQFRLGPHSRRLVDEPPRLAGTIEDGDVADAWLAAVAVSLSREIRKPPPPWATMEDRKLSTPWFAIRSAAIRATLIAESPAAFRERNLFVSENVLSRT